MALADTTYSLGVSVGDKYTYTLSELNDPDYLDDFSDFTAVGDKVINEITEITDETNYWSIEIESTVVKTEKVETETTPVFKEPSDGTFIFLICPVPVSTYIEELAAAMNAYYEPYAEYIEEYLIEASGTTFSFTMEGEGMIITFDANTGWATKMQVIENDEVVYVITGSSGAPADVIPGYELPLLLGITGLMAVGIIYTVMKKRTH